MASAQKQRRLSTGSASGAEESETVSDLTVARLRAFEEVQVAKQKMRTTFNSIVEKVREEAPVGNWVEDCSNTYLATGCGM